MPTIYERLTKVPFAGDILQIMNTYAYNGAYEAECQFAGIRLWAKCYLRNFTLSLIAAMFCMPQLINELLPFNHRIYYTIETQPGPLSTSILPSLLGFGIGVYALIFGLRANLLAKLQKHIDSSPTETPSSTLLLNASFAIPLLCLVISIAIGVLQTIIPRNAAIEFISWTSLWLSLLYTTETIFSIFGLGESHIITETTLPESTPPIDTLSTPTKSSNKAST